MQSKEENYIPLAIDPPTPDGKSPAKADCLKFEYMKMSQFCLIAKNKGIGGSRACNAFGGDKGQFTVITERMARAVRHGTQPRKFVKTTAVLSYFKEFGVDDW